MVRYGDMDRYQFQPWYIKMYRWLRHKPVSWLCAIYHLTKWAMAGCPMNDAMIGLLGTRRNYIFHIWMVCKSEADIKMGHYFYHYEILNELRK